MKPHRARCPRCSSLNTTCYNQQFLLCGACQWMDTSRLEPSSSVCLAPPPSQLTDGLGVILG